MTSKKKDNLKFSRPDFLKLGFAGTVAATLAGSRLAKDISKANAAALGSYTEVFPTSPLILTPFVDPLPIPKAMAPTPVVDWNTWASKPGPGPGKQNSYGNEQHQIWPSQIGYPDPIVYKMELKVNAHDFTSSQVLPIDSLGQHTISFDEAGNSSLRGLDTNTKREIDITAPATPVAQAWAGHRYGLQALKPALEPIIVFQKPYEGRPVECITETGAGALWIEGGRIPTNGEKVQRDFDKQCQTTGDAGIYGQFANNGNGIWETSARWPANFILSEAAAERLDEISGERPSGARNGRPGNSSWFTSFDDVGHTWNASTGGASRFFFRYQEDAIDEVDPVYYLCRLEQLGLEDPFYQGLSHVSAANECNSFP